MPLVTGGTFTGAVRSVEADFDDVVLLLVFILDEEEWSLFVETTDVSIFDIFVTFTFFYRSVYFFLSSRVNAFNAS